MKKFIPPFLLAAALVIAPCAFAQTYEDCVLENMKGVSKYAMNDIRGACRAKTLPKKCKVIYKEMHDSGKLSVFPGNDPVFASLLEQNFQKCLEDCEAANVLSRKFGECSP